MNMRVLSDPISTAEFRKKHPRSNLKLYQVVWGDSGRQVGMTLGQAYAMKAGLKIPRLKADIPPVISTLLVDRNRLEAWGFR